VGLRAGLAVKHVKVGCDVNTKFNTRGAGLKRVVSQVQHLKIDKSCETRPKCRLGGATAGTICCDLDTESADLRTLQRSLKPKKYVLRPAQPAHAALVPE